MDELFRELENSLKNLEKLEEQIRRIRSEYELKLETLKQLSNVNVDFEGLIDFLEEPYCILPKSEEEYWVLVPKFVDMQVGWLEHETKSYNIFVVNRYIQWLFEIPEELKRKLKIREKPKLVVEDGYLVTGKEFRDEAWRKYRDFLSRREEDRLKIKRGYEFELIAKLVEDGILPFKPRPVDKKDLRDFDGIKLRDYQEEAWRKFLETGAIGIFYPFGAGKSYFGVYALARIKGRKLVVVTTRTLVELWEKRISELIPQYRDEIDIITYHSYHKAVKKDYVLTIFDEIHHLPAPSFIKLATINTKYRIGLSGSPFREDGKENYIFALSGFPIGVDWKKFIDRGIVSKPKFKLYVVRNKTQKISKLEELLRIPVKTVIFCDSISLGEQLSKKLGIPFIHGKSRKRLDVINREMHVILSRVGDEGISIPDIERVIEVDFLYGSRMQESQRYGRLFHSKRGEPQHVIIMTEEEYRKYEKRLYAITERGFKVEVAPTTS